MCDTFISAIVLQYALFVLLTHLYFTPLCRFSVVLLFVVLHPLAIRGQACGARQPTAAARPPKEVDPT